MWRGFSGEEARRQLRTLVDRYFSHPPVRGDSGPVRLPLSLPAYGAEEVMEALDSLLTRQVTMGGKVREFERRFAEYIGVRHPVMATSGSTANLLPLSSLTNPPP